MDTPEPLDAEDVPWEVRDREVHVYPYGQEPLLWVRHAGAWRSAIVRAKHRMPDGRFAVQVNIEGLHPTSMTNRTLWWNPDRMKVRPRYL